MALVDSQDRHALEDVAREPRPLADAHNAGGPAAAIGAFSAGYLEHGGRAEWLTHFLADVMPCEGGGDDEPQPWWLFGDYSGSGYVSPAQFDAGSWATASAATGRTDPHNGYDVGANVGWWSAHIEHPGGTGGWPTCWWRGVVPP